MACGFWRYARFKNMPVFLGSHVRGGEGVDSTVINRTCDVLIMLFCINLFSTGCPVIRTRHALYTLTILGRFYQGGSLSANEYRSVYYKSLCIVKLFVLCCHN